MKTQLLFMVISLKKPFQAYYSGAIPIYLSNPVSENDINPKAIISANKFKSQQEMV